MVRRIQRSAALMAAVLVAATLLAACSSLDETPPAVGVTDVEVRDNSFSSRVIEVAAGSEITWTWTGDGDHNVVGDGWSSEVRNEGTFAHRFEQPGTYDYMCTLHGGMDGRVIATEGVAGAADGERDSTP